jgi:hypothetical protein
MLNPQAEETTKFFEEFFKKLGKTDKIDYSQTQSYVGKAAETLRDVSDNVMSNTILLKGFSGDQRVDQYHKKARFPDMAPEAEIVNLKSVVYYHPQKATYPKARSMTRIQGMRLLGDKENYKVETVQKRIDDAITAQEAARKILDDKEDQIAAMCTDSMCLLSPRTATDLVSGNQKFNLVSGTGYDNKENAKKNKNLSPAVSIVGNSGNFNISADELEYLPNLSEILNSQIDLFKQATA